MKRRDFVKIGMGGLTAIAVGSAVRLPNIFESVRAHAAGPPLTLELHEALLETIDLKQLYVYAFKDPAMAMPSVPGPVLFFQEGGQITITIKNMLQGTRKEKHRFAVYGVAGSNNTPLPGSVVTTPIPPKGGSATVTFKTPPPGTYIYADPDNDPVNRCLGAHGLLIVRPDPLLYSGLNKKTPYSADGLPGNVQNLFNALGELGPDGWDNKGKPLVTFPGQPWAADPAREWYWMFHGFDPKWHNLAMNNQLIDPVVFRRDFLARYFTINGKSGYFASHNHEISPSGHVGQPALIRICNTGLVTFSAHIHGNHVYVLSHNNEVGNALRSFAGFPQGSTLVSNNLPLVDTWTMGELDRVDWLLPFIYPPDIPEVPGKDFWLRDRGAEELTIGTLMHPARHNPFEWPMHCHTEMSQSGAGGNYPTGLVTHWEITGDLDEIPFVFGP